MTVERSVRDFVDLGLNTLEAEVYVYLLEHSPATGYKVAKDTGRPNSNTYKAIASLASKGAVIVDEGNTRLCRAVPADEFLDQMERRFHERKERARENVKNLSPATEDDRIYQLHTVDQVYERCRRMLADCRQVAFVDVFPQPLAALRPSIEEAAGRGVSVVVQAYEPGRIAGVRTVVNRDGAGVVQRWPAHWISMVADGEQYLIALLGKDEKRVHQAVWSASPILAWVYHSYIHSDFLLSELTPRLKSNAPVEKIRALYREWEEKVPYGDAPGRRILKERFGLG